MPFEAKKKGHRSHTTDEAIAEAVKEAQKGITIYMPESVHRKFKSKASENGEAMKDILLRAIHGYIEN